MKEYAIWGIPEGQTEETLLCSQITTREHLQKALDYCNAHATKVRVQTLDLSQPFNASDAMAKAIRNE